MHHRALHHSIFKPCESTEIYAGATGTVDVTGATLDLLDLCKKCSLEAESSKHKTLLPTFEPGPFSRESQAGHASIQLRAARCWAASRTDKVPRNTRASGRYGAGTGAPDQLSPMKSWNWISPLVVSALKLGTVSPRLSPGMVESVMRCPCAVSL